MNVAQEIRRKIEAQKERYAAFGIHSPELDKVLEEQLKKLDALEDIINRCETNEQKIRHADTDEAKNKSLAALQPLLEKFDIRSEVSIKEACVSFAPEVIVKQEIAENDENQEGFVPVTDQEYDNVPKYLKGRMILADLNAIMSSIESYWKDKYKLINRPLKALKPAEKKRVLAWREQDVSKCEGNICMTEAELKTVLTEKLKVQLKNALPVLRHLRIIKEIRNKQTVFICPYF